MAHFTTLVLTYRKAQLRVAEVLFDAEALNISVDIVRYFYNPSPVPGSRSGEFYSLWMNLKRDPTDLLMKMSRTTRAQIRRAQREGLKYEFASNPNRDWIEEFFEFFDSFAKSRNLKRVNRCRILALRDQNALDLSRISSSDGRPIVWHANIRSGKRAFCLYSASLFRNQDKGTASYISRANRLLHWSDMLRFREQGFVIYDFGGWYHGHKSEAQLRINCFKERFGGELVVQYNCDQAITWKGALALWLRAAAQWIRKNGDDPSSYSPPIFSRAS